MVTSKKAVAMAMAFLILALMSIAVAAVVKLMAKQAGQQQAKKIQQAAHYASATTLYRTTTTNNQHVRLGKLNKKKMSSLIAGVTYYYLIWVYFNNRNLQYTCNDNNINRGFVVEAPDLIMLIAFS